MLYSFVCSLFGAFSVRFCRFALSWISFCYFTTLVFIHPTHKNAKIAFDRLGKCLKDVKLWLCANKLKLNADKTDFIIFGSKSQQEKLNPFFPVNILGESLIPSDAVKNLGKRAEKRVKEHSRLTI